MTLNGKRIVIVGGTSGFGLATARAASDEGSQVVVVSHQKESIDRALSLLPKSTEGYVANFTKESEVKGLFEKIGYFDHLVYTAGDALKLDVAPLSETPLSEARASFDVRYWGMVMAAKYGQKNIRKGGSITFTNGAVGLRPSKGWVIPASVAGAIESLTRALAVELAPIRVNGVTAGLADTNLWSQMETEQRATFFENMAKHLPVGRVGSGDDLAQAYLFLMREEYCTGQMIVVDGGGTLV